MSKIKADKGSVTSAAGRAWGQEERRGAKKNVAARERGIVAVVAVRKTEPER